MCACVCTRVCVCDGGGGGNINACDLVSDPVEVVHMNSYSVLLEMSLLHMLSFSPSRVDSLCFQNACVCVCLCAQIHWHDFAFYDPVIYDSLCQLVVEAQQPTGAQHLEALQLTFQVQLRDEGGRDPRFVH